MDEQGIMALGQGMQAPTAQPMGVDPAAEAAFEQARLQMDPKEVGDELLAAGEQVDPAAVREFREAIQALRLPPEAIDAIGQMVDAILAEPQRYQEIRAELLAEGVPEDLLPVEFDAAFFGALNMALDQMSGMQEPMAMGPEGFADGGIVRLNPIAAGLARMGRNGDTMLAHITPAEARMLRRRGGSGTINPVTGLPEFFKALKKVFKAVGKVFKAVGKAVSKVVKGVVGAVKKFASSTVGRIVVGAALGFFLGPAAASFLGVGANTALAAGIKGFVGGFGSSVLAGDSLSTALRNGALSGVTAGGVSAVGGAPLTGGTPQYASVGDALSGQVAAAKEGIGSFFGGQEPAPIRDATTASLSATPEPSTVQTMASEGIATPTSPMAGDMGTAAPLGQADYSLVPEGSATPSLASQAGTGVSPTASGAMTTPTPQQLAAQNYTETVTSLGLPQNQFYPDIYNNALKAATPAVVAAPEKLSAFGELGQAARQVGDSQYMDALGSVGRAAFGTPTRAAVTGLGGMYLSGAFNQEPVESPGIAPKETGYDLLRQDPEAFGTSPGGAQTTFAALPNYAPFTPQFRPVQLNPVRYPEFQPRYAAQGGEIQSFADGGLARMPWFLNAIKRSIATAAKRSAEASAPAPRPFFVPGGAQTVPINMAGNAGLSMRNIPGYADGGLASLFSKFNNPEESNYQSLSLVYDPKNNKYLMVNPEYQAAANSGSPFGIMNLAALFGNRAAKRSGVPQYLPFDSGLFTSGMSPQAYANQQREAAVAASAKPFFTPGGAQTVPINMAGTAGLAVEQQPQQMFANGGIAALAPRRFNVGGFAGGGPSKFPRRIGQIDGPGTETSDDIPAMLSDGEFVMTAKAVRGAGNGSRRDGAKRMYQMMHKLERKA
jgi:hypothetical protein